jgi:hypothetical protein
MRKVATSLAVLAALFFTSGQARFPITADSKHDSNDLNL